MLNIFCPAIASHAARIEANHHSEMALRRAVYHHLSQTPATVALTPMADCFRAIRIL
jgi:hypothetical protein